MSTGSDRREGKRWLRGALRLAVGGSVAAATITLAPLGASAAGGWSIVSSPGSAAASNDLAGVTCRTATDCWAVGGGFNGANFQTLVERWNGAAWAVVASPNTSTTLDNSLTGVSCAAAADCWAVGTANNGTNIQTLAEHWN